MKDKMKSKKPTPMFAKKAAGTKKNEDDRQMVSSKKGESQKARVKKLDGMKI